MDRSDDLLFGREIYQLMESAWPAIANSGDGPAFLVDFARRLDRKPKYVFSQTLDQVTWQNSFLLKVPVSEVVPQLKAEGKSLLVNGGPGLGSTLAQLGLVDEYHFLVQPIVAGRGPRLLGGNSGSTDCWLIPQLGEVDEYLRAHTNTRCSRHTWVGNIDNYVAF